MAIVTPDAEFAHWLGEPEGIHLEFKKAENDYTFDKLLCYCAALANEGGGKIILGISDKHPRAVTGSQAFKSPERTVHSLTEKLHLRVDCEERHEPAGRVLIFHVPSRFPGMPVGVDGAYWMRSGESLVPMTQDQLRRIFDEVGPDFSAEICPRATLSDLDPAAVADFRARWMQKSGTAALAALSDEQLLRDAELLTPDGITHAAMILFGRRESLGLLRLGHVEVIFEYRSSTGSIPYQQRMEWRQGFFSFYDALWQTINLRNDLQSYQSGLFRYDIPTFAETVIREALLNAISHRDYRLGGSVFVRQFPRHVEIISPGGFPPGITPENILDQSLPRNRRIADALQRCGLIERSGQGMNRIYEETIRHSKPLPDFSSSAAHEVRLTLRGQIQNPAFLRLMEKLSAEEGLDFTTSDFLVLDAIQRDVPVPAGIRDRIPRLVEMGLVETIGRGRGTKVLFSRRFYSEAGQPGAYTRKRGLDHETNKTLLLQHMISRHPPGAPLAELCQVLPGLARRAVQRLLHELRRENRAILEGSRRGSRWLPATSPSGTKSPGRPEGE